MKSEQFRSIYLSEAYRTFGSENDVSLDDAQLRAQAFVDRCELAEKNNDTKAKDQLKELQWKEMKTIFDLTCH